MVDSKQPNTTSLTIMGILSIALGVVGIIPAAMTVVFLSMSSYLLFQLTGIRLLKFDWVSRK